MRVVGPLCVSRSLGEKSSLLGSLFFVCLCVLSLSLSPFSSLISSLIRPIFFRMWKADKTSLLDQKQKARTPHFFFFPKRETQREREEEDSEDTKTAEGGGYSTFVLFEARER